MSSLKDAAINLLNRRLSVFPVSNETKTPLVKWDRLQDALPSEAEVVEWFTPNNRSIGVATGPVSNILLLDFDFAKHPESKVWWEANKHRIPRTWAERTKSGGLHYYFRWSEALAAKQTNTTGEICKGVDTKGYGGYAKISPSEGYSWINPPQTTILAACPEWLLALLPERNSFKQIKPLEQRILDIQEGNRDQSFTSIAGSLRAKGYTPEAIFELLRPKAKEVDFADADLWRICQSVGRYEPNVKAGSDENVPAQDFLSDLEPVVWLVDGLIPEQGVGYVNGLEGTCKTWAVMDLAIELARGGKWLGKFPVEKRVAMFINQERPKNETQRRIAALLAGKGLGVYDGNKFIITDTDIKQNLIFKSNTTIRIDLPQSYEAFRNDLIKTQTKVVLVDSWSTFHTKEESNNTENMMVLERIKTLRDELKCTFIFIDHENKASHNRNREGRTPDSGDQSGASAKARVAEFCLAVVAQDGESSFVYSTKATQGFKSAPFLIKVTDLNKEKTQIKVEAY